MLTATLREFERSQFRYDSCYLLSADLLINNQVKFKHLEVILIHNLLLKHQQKYLILFLVFEYE